MSPRSVPLHRPPTPSLQRAGTCPPRAPGPASRRRSPPGAGSAAGEGRPDAAAAACPAAGRAPCVERQGGTTAEPRPGEPSTSAQASGQLRLPAVPAPVQLLSVGRPHHESIALNSCLFPVQCAARGASGPPRAGYHTLIHPYSMRCSGGPSLTPSIFPFSTI